MEILTPFIVTQADIFTSCRSTEPSGTCFNADRNAPLPLLRIRSFGTGLIPDHYRRQIPRPVSCYALFKWWLLLSQHPGCLCNPTTLVTETCSGTLTGGLGCFPFDHGNYLPWTDSLDRVVRYSEFG